MTNVAIGIGLHALGGVSSASSIVPAKFTRTWHWNVYWLVFASVSLLILPMIGMVLTIPHFRTVMEHAPPGTIRAVVALGFLYGFGSYAFGWAIRLIGFSQTYCISIGFSASLGTVIPPLVWGGEPLRRLLHTSLGLFVAAALVTGLLGMYAIGLASVRKDRLKSLSDAGQRSEKASVDNARLGLLVALCAGALSSAYGLALQFGSPMADLAVRVGANPLMSMNIVFPFANGAAFCSTVLIIAPLILRGRVARQLTSGPPRTLARNYGLGVVGGLAWYLQFFFFGIAERFMGELRATSWALHMILLIIFAQAWGLYFAEWRGVDRVTRRLLHTGLSLLVAAVLIVSLGNADVG